jgi:hypothetical protein
MTTSAAVVQLHRTKEAYSAQEDRLRTLALLTPPRSYAGRRDNCHLC